MDKFIAHILVVDDDDGIRLLVKKYLMKFSIYKKKGSITHCLIQVQRK